MKNVNHPSELFKGDDLSGLKLCPEQERLRLRSLFVKPIPFQIVEKGGKLWVVVR
jgi:hypothetical protein